MRIGLKPLNPTVGDIDGNARLIAAAIDEAKAAGVELLVLPELCVCGYPPMDLLWREGFVEACERAAEGVGRAHTDGIAVVMGLPMRAGGRGGRRSAGERGPAVLERARRVPRRRRDRAVSQAATADVRRLR